MNETSAPNVTMFPGQDSELPDTALGRAQLRDLLETAVSDLPPHLRPPFLLCEVEEMSILAIASQLQINPITVRTRIFHPRRRLQTTIENRVWGGFEAIFPFSGTRCANMTSLVIARLQAVGAL
ncbi:sigma factor-like helix-turn-helix DNA-binding protein [uncultured Ruegeria sp.]|uniref:sigma factor-like helix-turn-helix DNA-binding protein n=1 Tax=uncultured Ruegeria sp. TaxID=259304 RepID=UPI002620F7ED|nr:sigma factor-like helix-turn-helix DNA-binding protein [uncultured Ruegeria sp.]